MKRTVKFSVNSPTSVLRSAIHPLSITMTTAMPLPATCRVRDNVLLNLNLIRYVRAIIVIRDILLSISSSRNFFTRELSSQRNRRGRCYSRCSRVTMRKWHFGGVEEAFGANARSQSQSPISEITLNYGIPVTVFRRPLSRSVFGDSNRILGVALTFAIDCFKSTSCVSCSLSIRLLILTSNGREDERWYDLIRKELPGLWWNLTRAHEHAYVAPN